MKRKSNLRARLRPLACALALALGVVGGASAAELDDGGAFLYHDGWVSTEETLMWRNVRVADLTDFSALMWGGNVYSSLNIAKGNSPRTPYWDAPGFVMSNDGENAFVQFRQFDSGTIWCVKVQFTQHDADVYAKALWARYHQKQASIDVDLETN